MKSKILVLGVIISFGTHLPLLAQEEVSTKAKLGSGHNLQESMLKRKKNPKRKVVAASIEESYSQTLQDILLKSRKKRNRKIC